MNGQNAHSNIIRALLLSLFTVPFLFLGCESETPDISPAHRPFIVGNETQKHELIDLFSLLENGSSQAENRFIVIQEITKTLHVQERRDLLNLFLTTYVEKHPEDPFNGYYLLIVARNYLEEEAESFAIHYFERILKNHPDLEVENQSIHYLCLQNLIELVDDPHVRVSYYKSLISRFSNRIEMGATYYHLAHTYEELGEWDLAIQAYRNFLGYPDAEVEGAPNAHERIQTKIEFYDYKNKNWTMESLEDLVNTIKYAIRTRNASLLSRYRAKVNFFAVSWEEQKVEANQSFLKGLNTFLNRRIHYSGELDLDSNAQEAYLKTWGWSYRIKTWYIYFRRVHFPSDPEIHGQWEWGGIYFGEKPFAGTRFPQ